MAAAAALVALGVAAGASRSGSTRQHDDQSRAPGFYASSPAVCTLLTPTDLRSALGRTFAEGEDPGLTNTFADMPGVSKCRYPQLGKEGTPFVEIGVVYAYAEDISAAVAHGRKAYRSTEVTGLGRAARWYPRAGELVVRADDKILGVYVPAELLEDEADVGERARRLAARAIERL